MRKLLHRVVAGIAGFVYQRGVDLYRLSDWLDRADDETHLTEPELAKMWVTGEPTTTATGNVTVNWTKGPT
jgi:hypothetical protein